MMLAALLLVGVSAAQNVDDIELPEFNAQLWRPPVDGTHTLWTLDSGLAPNRWATARAFTSYVMDPLVLVFDEGERVELVSDVVQLDLTGALSLGRVRLGLDAPIYLLSRGALADGGLGTGDVMLDVKGTLYDRESAPVGFALDGRLLMPTATVDLPLGSSGLGWELAAVVDKQLGPVLLAANLGTRGQPRIDLANATVDDQFFFRLGGGYEITERVGVSADLAGAFTYVDPLAGGAGAPLELLVGGWGRVADRIVVRGGAGTGLTPGIGSPVFRALLSVGYEPPRVRDADGDGLLDNVDACPEAPEDIDGWMDDDGCPDPTVEVQVRVLGPDGAVLSQGSSALAGDGGAAEGAGELSSQLHPGAYSLTASAKGYQTKEVSVTVPDQGPALVDVTLDPLPGRLQLTILGPDEQPLAAEVTLVGVGSREAAEGSLEASLLPGTRQFTVQAPGYVTAHVEAEILPDETAELVVHLKASQAEVTAEKIEIRGEVYFDTGKDTIKPESFDLLDEVAGILAERQDIVRVRIEGHTDERGKASTNQTLSERRAAAVRTYLMDKGIAPERLSSVGFGESRPVDRGHNERAWDKNRRVEFMIEAWAKPE